MIYTSFMGNLKNITKEKVSIMRDTPSWCSNYIDKKEVNLAPSRKLYKRLVNKDITYDEFSNKYIEELGKLNIKSVMSKYQDSVLLCTCKLGNFCHRHILGKYLLDNGVKNIELSYNSKDIIVELYSSGPLKEGMLLLIPDTYDDCKCDKRKHVIEFNKYKQLNDSVLAEELLWYELHHIVRDMYNGKKLLVIDKPYGTSADELGVKYPRLAIKVNNFINNNIVKYIKRG